MSFFDQFRLAVRNQLGFETFHPESLDDHVEVYAFLIPNGTYGDVIDQLKEYLAAFFLLHGRETLKVSFHGMGTYMYNWCGTRHITAHLEEHLLFYVHPCTPQNLMNTVKKPVCGPWLVAQIDYDRVQSELYPESRMRFDTTLSAATLTGEYHEVLNRLREQVEKEIDEIMNINKH